MILNDDFFRQKTTEVARLLIGSFLVRLKKGEKLKLLITETEAYRGEYDLACHAARGKTTRNKIMYESAGFFYVYLVYGLHWMLNVVTEEKGFPAAVLIRGGVLKKEDQIIELNGPAKVTKFLNINGQINEKRISKKTGLWLEKNQFFSIRKNQISRKARVGVEYARYCKKWKWNFYLKNELKEEVKKKLKDSIF